MESSGVGINRRRFLGGVGAVVVLPALSKLATYADASTGSVYFGLGADSVTSAYAESLETKLGREFACFRWNGTDPTPQAVASYNRCFDAGWHWGYANGKPSPASGSYVGYWKDTANGVYDSFWNNYFLTVKADTRWTATNPLHFSFHHEQNVDSEGGGLKNGTPADFKAAFRHVMGLMMANHAHASQGGNMLRCWTPHWLQITSSSNPFYKCNPGVANFDLLGCDIYNTKDNSYTADQQWTPVHNYAKALGKPFFTGEQGVAGSDTKVVTYLKRLDTLLKSYGGGMAPGNIVALNITTKATAQGGNYAMDSTPAILAEYQKLAADPFYGLTA